MPKRPEKERLSWSLLPYDTCQPGGFGPPEASTPRHLPPSGFEYPLDGFHPSGPGRDPSITTASMGLSLQGLAPPGQRYPSRGLASLVVSPLPLSRGRARLQRLTLVGKGNESRRRKRPRPSNLALLGVLPLQGFLLRHLWTGFPIRALHALPSGSAPYVSTSGRGSKGL